MIGGVVLAIHVVFIIGLTATLYLLFRHRSALRPGQRRAMIVIVPLFSCGLLYLVGHLTVALHDTWVLNTIPADQVVETRIVNQSITDPSKIESIISTLNRSEWFFPNHGGWAKSETLMIRLESGESLTLQVARYLREGGAILQFDDGGYSYSRDLPEALQRSGVSLPSEPAW